MPHPLAQPFNHRVQCHNTKTLNTTIYVDQESSSAASILDQPEVDDNLRSPEEDDSLEEDDSEEHEEPTAAEIVQAGIAQGHLDKECAH